jgi:benzoyl-CoA reductase/2-hydroxyglutaryl-CoA dehydratase subunit BcrC/BadD/HgdB
MSDIELIKEARRIVTDPYGYIRGRSNGGQRYIGYNCLFVPEEVLHAAGFVPIRMLGKNNGLDTSAKYIPSQCCEFVKNLISSFDNSTLGFLEAAVFGFCCDTMQIASSILRERKLLEVFQVNIPTKFGGELSRRYLIKEIDLFRHAVEDRLNTRISERALYESIEIYQENARLLNQLKQFKRTYPESLSAADFLAVLSMGYFIPKEAHNTGLKEMLEALTTRYQDVAEAVDHRKKRIILSGFLNNDIDLVERIENLGVSIVDEDLCEGSRYLTAHQTGELPPAHLIADRILSRYCPVKSEFKMDYSEILIKKYREAAADGIVIFIFRFCDPQYMEYAMARSGLEDANIPFIVLEPVIGGDNFKQIETRLEAFIENL